MRKNNLKLFNGIKGENIMIVDELKELKRVVKSFEVKIANEEHSLTWYHMMNVDYVRLPDSDIIYTINKDNRLDDTGVREMKFKTQCDRFILDAIFSDEVQKLIFIKALELAKNKLDKEIALLKEQMEI